MKFQSGHSLHLVIGPSLWQTTSSSCLLCHQPGSQIHVLSDCQNASIQVMVTEPLVVKRHNLASRLIIKTLIKGQF